MNSKPQVVCVRKSYPVPRERVYRAWINPKYIAQWFGPKGFRAEVLELDLRVGGTWRFQMIGAGNASVCHFGTYVEIDPPNRLVFTWAPETWPDGWFDADVGETLVTVEFRDQPTGTEVVITHENLASDGARTSLTGGWSGALESLDEFMLGVRSD